MNPQQPIVPQPQQPVPVPNQPYTVPPKKSRKTLILSIIGGAVALLAIGITIFFIFAYPSIQSRSVANKFMSYMTTDKISDATKMTDGDNENRDFLDGIAEKLEKGTYKLSEEEYNKTGTSYYLFNITGANTSKARVNLAKKSGKTIVESIAVGDSLDLKGKVSMQSESKEADAKATDDKSTDTSAKTSQSSTCYASSDFDTALGYKNKFVYSASNPYITNVHFNGDSTEYAEPQESIALDGIDLIIDIVKNNPGKPYTISLTGGVASTDASYIELAGQRAQKIKAYMISHGIDEKSITITARTAIDSEMENDVSMRMARVVVVGFMPDCMK